MAGQSRRMNSDTPSLIQVQVQSGMAAGHTIAVNQLPIRLGRGKGCQLQLADHGVWEQHAELDINESGQFILRRHPEAGVMINGEPAEECTALCNGDAIELGSAKLQFWLGTVRQKNLAAREAAAWALLAAVTVAEVILLLWLT